MKITKKGQILIMRRIIEELIEKRKQQQKKIKKTLEEISCLLKRESPFKFFTSLKKKNKKIHSAFLDLNDDLKDLITTQDKEWDAYANNHSTMVFKSLEWKIEKLEAEYSQVKTLLVNFLDLEKSLEGLINSIQQEDINPQTTGVIQQLSEMKERISPYQYSNFEQRFRGDEIKVKEKLKKYLPIFSSTDHILDIGCGRGEFIELLRETDIQAEGIDISESMLRIALDKGLACKKIDSLEYLEQQPDESWGGIFSAQVIEHLTPDYLKDLIIHAYRVLRQDSPILLETVNPLSVFALSNIYYLDITHQKPLHPEFMRYLLESTGFREVNIIYPEELKEEQLEGISPENQLAREFNSNVDKLNKLLYASPIYAVTGKK